MTAKAAIWRKDADALAFAPLTDDGDHGGPCMVHRRAFRVLTGCDPATPEQCLEFFDRHAAAFHRAAATKIRERTIPQGRSLNLNSRDIRRALGVLDAGQHRPAGKSCGVLTDR